VIAILGLLIGVVIGLVVTPDVPLWMQPYLPIAVVAALDAVFGALRAYLDGIFDDKVFTISFFSNVTIAALIVYLGDKLGVGSQLSTGVIVVLGIRIFSNVAAIRRHIFHACAHAAGTRQAPPRDAPAVQPCAGRHRRAAGDRRVPRHRADPQ
jgi:small basic protein